MATRDDILTKLGEGLLALDGDPNYNEPSIASMFRHWPVIHELPDDMFPCIILDDNGNVPGPEHDGLARFNTLVNISAVVRGDDADDLVDRIELMSEALTNYLYSQPVIHDNVLDIKVVEREDVGIFTRINQNFAEVLIAVRILWWDRVKAASTATGTFEIWSEDGSAWLETARDKLYARITDLKTELAAGDYLPLYSYTYPRHAVPDLQLNAVTVGVLGVEQEAYSGSESGNGWTYQITFTVRIHTAYLDDTFDDQVLARLVNSIVNKIRARTNLVGGFWVKQVSDVDLAGIFTESESQGGEFAVQIETHVRHVQE